MQDDIILNKFDSIKNCLKSIRDNYPDSREKFCHSFLHQDAAVLNIQRAAQTAIDIASHVVRLKKLSLPRESRDLFDALYKNKMSTEETKTRMVNMVGFRNIAVHEYKRLDVNVVISVIEKHLTDFERFMHEIFQAD